MKRYEREVRREAAELNRSADSSLSVVKPADMTDLASEPPVVRVLVGHPTPSDETIVACNHTASVEEWRAVVERTEILQSLLEGVRGVVVR